MNGYDRYAIYWAPEAGAFADASARWLGWDPAAGAEVAHPAVQGLPRPLAEITETPRKYGFHGTVKPPFRLATGTDASALHAAAQVLCKQLAPVTLPGLTLERLDGFVALTPRGDQTALATLATLAARVVEGLDQFRAPPDAAEIARRRVDRLTERQRTHLLRWGYPYVMDDFQFHLTLTGDLPAQDAQTVAEALAPYITPLLPAPFRVDTLCLFGQAQDGRFRLLHRYTLSG